MVEKLNAEQEKEARRKIVDIQQKSLNIAEMKITDETILTVKAKDLAPVLGITMVMMGNQDSTEQLGGELFLKLVDCMDGILTDTINSLGNQDKGDEDVSN